MSLCLQDSAVKCDTREAYNLKFGLQKVDVLRDPVDEILYLAVMCTTMISVADIRLKKFKRNRLRS